MAAPFFISGSAFLAASPFIAAPPFISDWPAFGWSLAPSAAEAIPAPAINATAATVASSDFFISNVSSGVPTEPISSVRQATSNRAFRSGIYSLSFWFQSEVPFTFDLFNAYSCAREGIGCRSHQISTQAPPSLPPTPRGCARLPTNCKHAAPKPAQGGSPRTRERHLARGKLLPRDRVMRLIDPGSPVPGAVAARRLRHVRRRHPRRRPDHRHRPRRGPRMRDRLQRLAPSRAAPTIR